VERWRESDRMGRGRDKESTQTSWRAPHPNRTPDNRESVVAYEGAAARNDAENASQSQELKGTS
jgi:hypothetical protein